MNNVVKNISLIVIAIILFVLLIIYGSSKNNTRFHLDEKYYNSGNVIKLNSEELNKISNESPLAKAIMNASVGDVCNVESPNGSYQVTIVNIK